MAIHALADCKVWYTLTKLSCKECDFLSFISAGVESVTEGYYACVRNPWL